MILPTIHLNGTSGKALADGYEAAWDAIQAAYDALKKTAPNGRDYYLDGSFALTAAVKEHDARLARLADVMDELDTLMSHCTKGQS